VSDESILGLLLRAHGLIAGQAHGEQYVHHNISASNCYENAMHSIESAIKQVGFADTYIARQDGEKKRKQEATAPA
jgi:hypothetical protein